VSGAQGVQALNFIDEKMNTQQLNGSITTSITTQNNRWQTDPFLLNPYSTPPLNALYTGPAPSVADDDKIFIKSVKSELRIVSLTNVAQRVKVFYYLAVKTSSVSITNLFSDVVVAGAFLQASSASAPSTIAGTTCTPGSYTNADLGVVPHQYRNFRKYFKLVHGDQFMLQPGDQISKPVDIVVNKMVSKEEASKASASYIPGLTLCTLVIVDAGLVGLETTLDSGVTRCAPGAAKIGYVVNDKYHFSALPVNRYDIHRLELGYNQVDTTDVRKIVDSEDKGVTQEVE